MRISDWSSDVCSSDLLGLITRVVDDEALAEEADKVAAQLSASATRAMGRTRNLLLSSFTNSLEEQMELDARAISLSSRDEGREGGAAFLAKRTPDFTSWSGLVVAPLSLSAFRARSSRSPPTAS